jgi:glycosyltransferase involved in cell wall biosynthesis
VDSRGHLIRTATIDRPAAGGGDPTTVHFVYPHRPRISAPSAIGRKVTDRLRQRGYAVVNYDIDEPRVIRPGRRDVLLGHPHEAPWSVFRRSAAQAGWKRRLMLMPYVHVDDYHLSLAEPVIRNCDLFLAITGRSWFESVDASITAHWLPKMIQVDLAVDPVDFPRVKTTFNPPTKRRFLYIGHTGWYKNTAYLAELSRRLSEFEFSWIGSGKEGIPGLTPLGRRDFRTVESKQLVAEHDFLLTVGVGDANPTTVLEAMSWGLIPVCTPESGYREERGIVTVPARDPAAAEQVLRDLQTRPAADLTALQASNDARLEDHFNWDRFTQQVVSAIESDDSPDLGPVPRTRQLSLRWLSAKRQASVVAPHKLRETSRALLSASGPGRSLLEAYRRGQR